MYERQPHRQRRSSPYTELDQYLWFKSDIGRKLEWHNLEFGADFGSSDG